MAVRVGVCVSTPRADGPSPGCPSFQAALLCPFLSASLPGLARAPFSSAWLDSGTQESLVRAPSGLGPLHCLVQKGHVVFSVAGTPEPGRGELLSHSGFGADQFGRGEKI